ncbi:MAG: SBBP repeat-containing protein [Bacteroidota bacterium]
MKIKLLIITILMNFCLITAKAQSFEWAKRVGWYAFDLGYGVATDGAGNVYIAGKYELEAYFGGTRVSCAGNHDIYVAKYGPDGSFKWVRTAGGVSGDYAHAIVADGAGNVYVTGDMERTVKFGSVTLTGNGSNDVFVAKYNTNGDLMWAKKLGGSNQSDRGLGIALITGSVYITGHFKSIANFAGTKLTSSGEDDIFIAKYSTDGQFQWIKKAGGPGDDEGTAITGDASGNIYVTGFFAKTANFGSFSVTSKGVADIFIAKYNSSGTCIWVKSAGSGATDYGYGVAADNSGRIFVTGGFRYTTSFSGISLKASGGNADIFVACYNSSGNIIWAKKAGGSQSDYGRAIAIDGSSNIYITGNYGLSATFGSTTITGADETEIYFASYDASGNVRWVLKAGGVTDDSDPDRFIEMGLSICVDKSRNVIASGAYRSASTFGSTTLAKWNHTEVYVTKIRQSGSARSAAPNVTITPSDTASFCTGGSVLLTTAQDSAYQYIWKKDNIVINGAKDASYKANTPGSYSVIVISGADTLESEATIITESRSITASIKPEGPLVCKDTPAVLTANEGYGFIYQWKRDGEIIPGATSSSYKTDASGNYQVKIIQGSCFDWSAHTKVSLECPIPDSSITGISKNFLKERDDSLLFVKIYPNPNNGLFTLEINMSDIAGEVKIELVNAMGQLIHQKSILTNNGYINEHMELESTVPLGIYFLQVTIGAKVEITRMMLTR